MNRITLLLTPPVFEGDEERTHHARLLYVILWTLILAITLLALSANFVLPGTILRWLVLASIVIIMNLALLVLNWHGYPRRASIALIVEL